MKPYLLLTLLLACCCACSTQRQFQLEDLQGAWWSDKNNPTADFAITGAQVWLDYDSAYHPCEVTENNMLVFDLGPDGRVEHKIVSMDTNNLLLENLVTHTIQSYFRME